MESIHNLRIEEKLSFINARLADVSELLQSSTAVIKQSCNIICGLESEIEEIYLSINDDKNDENSSFVVE